MNITNIRIKKSTTTDIRALKTITILSMTALLLLMSLLMKPKYAEAGEIVSLSLDKNTVGVVESAHVESNTVNVSAVQSYYVDSSVRRSGSGSVSSPFKTIQEGVNAARPGDIVWVVAGEYNENIETVRDGEEDRPITVRSNPPVQVPYGAAPGWTPENESQRVWIRREGRSLNINHSHFIIDGINVDGLWHGNGYIDDEGIFRDSTTTGTFASGTNGIVVVGSDAESVVLRNIEVKNNQRHLIRVSGNNVVFDNARIHNGIARTRNTPAPSPGIISGDDYFRDAHGIEGSGSFGLTITNTYIGYVSGDCVQLGRSEWGDFLVENSHFEIAPLDEPILGLAVGTWFGEDHFDTKTPNRGQEGAKFNKGVTFRNNTLNGTRHSRYQNGAILNLKEGVEHIVFEGNLVYDNRMTLRLRRPTTGYVIRNNVFFDNERVISFSGSITNVQILNNTFYDNEMTIRGRGISNANIAANIFANGPLEFESDGPPDYWQHNLYFQTSGVIETNDKIIVADPLFVDPGNGNFQLQPDSPALFLGIGARPTGL